MKKILLLSAMTLIVFIFHLSSIFAQDIPYFEIIDNESVGLTVTPYTKWGMAIADIDRNGYPDIFVQRYAPGGAGAYSRIFVNTDKHFTDITDQSPIEQIEIGGEEFRTLTSPWVDFDNDGDLDLTMSTTTAIHLLQNDNNTFTDVSEAWGFVGHKPDGFIVSWWFNIGDWADYDLDGDLDCIVCQENNESLYLFRNDGDHFTNVASEVGLENCLTDLYDVHQRNWIATFFDFDLDGDPDICGQGYFFINNNGVFTDVTDSLGFADLDGVAYREFFDYDNDGDLDFFKATGNPSGDATHELWENRDGYYYNISQDVGLSQMRDRIRSITIGDMDNDGDLDIVLSTNIQTAQDYVLVNDEVEPGVRAFANVVDFVGVTKMGDRKGAAFFDYDRDGFLDIYVPSAEYSHALYHNFGTDGNWIGFILEGTMSNRGAVGSLVTLYTGEKKQIRYTVCAKGRFRQDNPWVHFGIGYETEIDSVVIRWPLGYKQVLTDVAINQYHEIKEPDLSSVEKWQANSLPAEFQLEQNYPNPFNPSTTIGYYLPRDCEVELIIYNVIGRHVKTLIKTRQGVGRYKTQWDGRDEFGTMVPAGLYFYQIKAHHFTQTRKMVFVQ